MMMAQLTSERVREFRQVKDHVFKAEGINSLFPAHLRFDVRSKILLGCCPRSKNGSDFSVSRNLLDYLISLEEASRVGQSYIILFSGERTAPEIVFQITTKELRKRLRSAILQDGKYGEYWWVDENGNPTGASRPRDDDDGFNSLPF